MYLFICILVICGDGPASVTGIDYWRLSTDFTSHSSCIIPERDFAQYFLNPSRMNTQDSFNKELICLNLLCCRCLDSRLPLYVSVYVVINIDLIYSEPWTQMANQITWTIMSVVRLGNQAISYQWLSNCRY